MRHQGSILIADDDETFLMTTADVLRYHGYEVDTAVSASTAMSAIRAGHHDLLISDLNMPGNDGLRLVRDVAVEVGGLPIIILTGLPSTESAVASIDLPVAAYMVKPINVPELLDRIRTAITRFRAFRTMRDTEARMERWRQELEQITAGGSGQPRDGAPMVDAFMALTLRNVMGSLSDLGLLGQALSGQRVDAHPCQLMNCPRGAQLHAAVRETIAVLEETKSSFKSKRLADLRHQLELLIALV